MRFVRRDRQEAPLSPYEPNIRLLEEQPPPPLPHLQAPRAVPLGCPPLQTLLQFSVIVSGLSGPAAPGNMEERHLHPIRTCLWGYARQRWRR